MSILTVQTSAVKNPSLHHKITKASRRFLVLCTISLLSIKLLTPLGFIPGAILHGQLIKPCPNSFPKYISDILESSHHHHDGETEIKQGCAFASQLSDPIFVTQNFRGTASKTHSTTKSTKRFYLSPLVEQQIHVLRLIYETANNT